MSNYRAYEDRYGFIKFFISVDAEFDIVLRGLDSLKGSPIWGKRAKELQTRFIEAFDGLISHKLPDRLQNGELPEPTCLMDEYLNDLSVSGYFKPCDTYDFRKIHDECIRLFKEVRDNFDCMIKDDRNDYSGK